MPQMSNEQYGRFSIALHWLMLALIAAVYACIELRVNFPRGSDVREGLKHWHFMLGLTVLTLVMIRAAVRLRGVTPPITPAPPAWMKGFARLGHLALYLLMFGMPIAGWIILSAEGEPVPFYGLVLPPLVAPDEAFAKSVEEIHSTAGTVGYYLIGLHAAVALLHHYVRRDNALTRMLPWLRRGALQEHGRAPGL